MRLRSSLIIFSLLFSFFADVAYGEPLFERAMHGDGEILEVETSLEIAWKSLAPSRFEQYRDPSTLAQDWATLERLRDMFDNASFDYEAPLDHRLVQHHCYFLTDQGIRELFLINLKGTVRLGLDRSRPEITHRSDFGHIVAYAKPRLRVKAGGFAVCIEGEEEAPKLMSEVFASGQNEVQMQETASSLTLSEQLSSVTRKKFYYSFRFRERDYAFLRLDKGSNRVEGLCSSYYQIVEMKEGLPAVAVNHYRCDI